MRRCSLFIAESFDRRDDGLDTGRRLGRNLSLWRRLRRRRLCGLDLKSLLRLGGEFAGGRSQIGEHCAFLLCARELLRTLCKPSGALRHPPGHLLLNPPAVCGQFVGRCAARLPLVAGFCFRCLDNAADNPDYGHHDNDENVHPSAVRAPLRQNYLCQQVAHKSQCTSL